MRKTRLFKNGNSQAVRIPAELAYERTDLMLEIERIGDELRIRPVKKPQGCAQEIRALPYAKRRTIANAINSAS